MAHIFGVSQHSRRSANRGPRHSISDRKPAKQSSKQPLIGGLGSKKS